MTRVCIFDLETRKLAQELDAIESRGWDKLKRGEGGVSALAIYDSVEDWVYTYDDHSILEAAEHLESADVVVGFRSEGFDVPIVEGLIKRKLVLKGHLDIHELVRKALLTRGRTPRRGENTLDAISRRTLGRGKIDKGEHAPQLANEGKWGWLFRYCMDDVRLTRDLYLKICSDEGIISVEGTFLPLELPTWLKDLASQSE